MHGHHGYARSGVIRSLVLVGQQTHLMDKISDTRIFVLCCAVVHILANTAQQLLKVSFAVHTLR